MPAASRNVPINSSATAEIKLGFEISSRKIVSVFLSFLTIALTVFSTFEISSVTFL